MSLAIFNSPAFNAIQKEVQAQGQTIDALAKIMRDIRTIRDVKLPDVSSSDFENEASEVTNKIKTQYKSIVEFKSGLPKTKNDFYDRVSLTITNLCNILQNKLTEVANSLANQP